VSVNLVLSRLASDHPILISDGALKFTPEAFSAEIGDTVTFHFYPKVGFAT
jgi:plastocyanin